MTPAVPSQTLGVNREEKKDETFNSAALVDGEDSSQAFSSVGNLSQFVSWQRFHLVSFEVIGSRHTRSEADNSNGVSESFVNDNPFCSTGLSK